MKLFKSWLLVFNKKNFGNSVLTEINVRTTQSNNNEHNLSITLFCDLSLKIKTEEELGSIFFSKVVRVLFSYILLGPQERNTEETLYMFRKAMSRFLLQAKFLWKEVELIVGKRPWCLLCLYLFHRAWPFHECPMWVYMCAFSMVSHFSGKVSGKNTMKTSSY